MLKDIILQRGRLYVQKQRDYVYVRIRVNSLFPNEARKLRERYGGTTWTNCYYYTWSSSDVESLISVLNDVRQSIDPALASYITRYCLAPRGKFRTIMAQNVARYLKSGSVELKECLNVQ